MSTKGILWYYPNDYVRNDEFRRRYQNALRDCLAQPESPDSQVLESLSGQGTLFQRFRREETSRRLEALVRELEYNSTILDVCLSTAKSNIAKPKTHHTHVTDRTRTSALELLVTNRYVEEQAHFYSFAENVLSDLLRMNGQIDNWGHFSETDEWISRQLVEKGVISDVKDFAKAVKDVRQRLLAES
jgi:hypothetical protein